MSEVIIKSTGNGPNLVVVNGRVTQARCRCGRSGMMPFCDGTHKRKGFKAAAKEVKVR